MLAFAFGLIVGLILGIATVIVAYTSKVKKQLEKSVEKIEHMVKPKAKAVLLYPQNEDTTKLQEIVAENDKRGVDTPMTML